MIKQLSPPGRFLKYDSIKNLQVEIEDKAAIGKASQALREKKSFEQPSSFSKNKTHDIIRKISAIGIAPDSKIPNFVEAPEVDTCKAVIPDDNEIDYLIYQTFCRHSKLTHENSHNNINMSSSIADAVLSEDCNKVENESIKLCASNNTTGIEEDATYDPLDFLARHISQMSRGKEKIFSSHESKESIYFGHVQRSYFDAEMQSAKKKARIFKMLKK